ncbi:MAG: prepilin-type N-terminal cleavage/methylation domain-containing protein [Phycisphaerales bacterium]|nr:prepilin-type N-terminal cleavage/methylation domain-containing protein [Phycisphaerales bacterium]
MNTPSPSRPRAFTVVELLATIAIIALLLGFLLPALSSARASSKLIQHKANIRDLLIAIDMYAETFIATYPFMGVPGHPELGVDELNDLEPPGSGISFNAGYFAANSFHWPTVMVRAGFDIALTAYPDEELRQRLSDRYQDSSILGTIYQMTHATVSTPAYWQPGLPPEPTATYLHAMKTHQLKFPSAKGMLLAMTQGLYDDTDDESLSWILVGLGDGSVSKRNNPETPTLEPRPNGVLPFSILSTIDGLQGRDF